ncbi:hypothetical protein FA15DRAFT_708151 [Coprinopsis marcescibilis]|uniref:F-box domain-containing protein n=1 Tax=Coprinopsis marcescibilis TaxID=230819 RepID=A0A5C3KJS7_COPMA|nr:hypothetical protein FA15DRAFT_708151 [Coprinopsis marcescibilis]
MSELALELVEHIASFLEGDVRSLRKASLVSSRFGEPFQKLLFSELRLEVESPEYGYLWRSYPGKKLLTLLQSPRIGSYVKSITISDGPSYGWGHDHTWIADDADLPKALRLLPLDRFTKLTINGVWFGLLPPATKNAIAALCSSPSLVSLFINDAPIDFINFCGPSVVNFVCRNTDTSLDLLEKRTTECGWRLQTMALYRHWELCEIIGFLMLEPNQVGLVGLKKLHVDISTREWDDYGAVQTLLRHCARTLEVFSFFTYKDDYGSETWNCIDLSGLPNLRQLSFCGTYSFRSTNRGCHPLPKFVKQLAEAASSTLLEHVRIYMDGFDSVGGVREEDQDQDELDGEGFDAKALHPEPWQRLDALLTGTRFPNMKRVEVLLSDAQMDVYDCQERIEEFLSGLRRRGMLEVTPTSDGYNPF